MQEIIDIMKEHGPMDGTKLASIIKQQDGGISSPTAAEVDEADLLLAQLIMHRDAYKDKFGWVHLAYDYIGCQIEMALSEALATGNHVKALQKIAEINRSPFSDNHMKMLHVQAELPGMSRALDMFCEQEFVRQRLYKDIAEAEEYLAGLKYGGHDET